MKLVILGATGLVGQEMIKVLEERGHADRFELIACASETSRGKIIRFGEKEIKLISPEEAIEMKPEYALFSAGGSASKQYAPLFNAVGTTVIDNSSAWRMQEDVPLVVPEINASTCNTALLIANPNCSTIQLVMVLAPLHQKYKIRRVIISTYQSVSGTGKKGVDQLLAERKGETAPTAYAWPIDLNVIPQCDVFLENNYTREEMKLVHESRKILNDSSLRISATAVRVPVTGGHSESVNIEFERPFDIADIWEILYRTEGIIIADNPEKLKYPMPLHSAGKDEVFVGRIRRDDSIDNGLNLWITADNLRKGAATNAVQILEYLLKIRHGIS